MSNCEKFILFFLSSLFASLIFALVGELSYMPLISLICVVILCSIFFYYLSDNFVKKIEKYFSAALTAYIVLLVIAVIYSIYCLVTVLPERNLTAMNNAEKICIEEAEKGNFLFYKTVRSVANPVDFRCLLTNSKSIANPYFINIVNNKVQEGDYESVGVK